MPLDPGTRLGPYEITAAIGAGGMGEVYRARDTRLDRTIAVKILPAHLSDNPIRRQRFEREARIISALNHPHICALYDVGHQDGVDYLVMECVEGESLAQRLMKGPLPLEQVLKVGFEIADALDRAHHSGVIHRDLKPDNIMLTKSGAKLLDFGLAKPVVPLANGPTLTSEKSIPVTQEGIIVGTFPYMSPEQMEGDELDGRTDIFSFGAVLYEMVTGKRAFEGKSQYTVASAVLERQPAAISTSKPMTPPVLERLVNLCLVKDREERLQSAHDLKLQLEWIRGAGSQAGVGPSVVARRKFSQAAGWILAAISLLAVTALTAGYYLRPFQAVRAVRSSLLPPAGWSFKQYNLAISPDGTRLAFVATGLDGRDTLWLRTLSTANAQRFEGAQGAMFPFWSPDSGSIGFFAEGKLKVIDIESGAVRVLCEAPDGRGGTWNRQGMILFAPDIVGPLYRTGETGGPPTRVTEIPHSASGQAHRWPYFLPDGNHFLYFVDWSAPEDLQQNGIYTGSLSGGQPELISADLAGNVEFASGNLLFVRDHSLMAQPFNPTQLKFTGEPVPIAQQEVSSDIGFSQAGFTASQNGVLVFESATEMNTNLAWFDTNGKELGKLEANGYGEPRVSPDGRFVAFDSDDNRDGKSYIRLYDVARGVSTRVTDGGEEWDPAWSPDGKQITYVTGVRSASAIYQLPADRSGPPQLVLKGAKMIHVDWSQDHELLFSSFAKGRPVLTVYSPQDKSLTEIRAGAEGRFSPNGRWIAGTGVSVSPFPRPSGRIQISQGVASQPVWSRDGRFLFFIASDKAMMKASFDPQTGRAGTPQVVFNTRIVGANFIGTQFDVTPDGKFLIHVLSTDHASPYTLLTNWTVALKRK
jgi:Tol biopolymer transport system component